MPRYHRNIKRMLRKLGNRTKVNAQCNLPGFAGSSLQTITLASAEDTTRANYYDIYVKPFSKIKMVNIDLAFYQDGSSVSADGQVLFAFVKIPSGSVALNASVCLGNSLVFVPYTFMRGNAPVPQLSSTGMPAIYHLHGVLKIPPRMRTFAPGDKLYLCVYASPAGAGVAYSVRGECNYMFEI